jgi:hypothetical protein
MVKKLSISAVLAGGFLAGALAVAGSANAAPGADGQYYGSPGVARSYDGPYDSPYYGSERRYDAPYYGRYGTPYYGAPEVLPQNGTAVTLGPNGVRLNLPGGAAISAGPNGVGGWVPAA